MDGPHRGFVLVDDGAPGRLGAAMVWAAHAGVSDLTVLVDGDPRGAAVIARRAALFAPTPDVLEVRGRLAAKAAPAGIPAPPPPPSPEVQAMLDLLSVHGIDPVSEHGVAKGEVLGLEVARVVGGPPYHLEVGVGSHDRQARSGLRPDQDPGAALDEVLTLVRKWRAPGARRHPANLLARERWLRAVLLARPALAGARRLEALPPVLPVPDLRLPVPAAAAGVDAGGRPLVVVCSTGVDPDLVPTAADHRLIDGRRAKLRLVVPEGDDYPLTRRLAAALVDPAEIVTVPRDWPALLG